MNMDELTGALEAVLFASGDPVSAQQMVDILGIDIISGFDFVYSDIIL